MNAKHIWRAAIGAMIAAGAFAAACSSRNRQPAAHPPPLGQSTAPGPSNSNVPPPDAAGVPTPDQPTPPANPPRSMTQPSDAATVAQEPADAGVFDGMLPDGAARAAMR